MTHAAVCRLHVWGEVDVCSQPMCSRPHRLRSLHAAATNLFLQVALTETISSASFSHNCCCCCLQPTSASDQWELAIGIDTDTTKKLQAYANATARLQTLASSKPRRIAIATKPRPKPAQAAPVLTVEPLSGMCLSSRVPSSPVSSTRTSRRRPTLHVTPTAFNADGLDSTGSAAVTSALASGIPSVFTAGSGSNPKLTLFPLPVLDVEVRF